MPLSMDEKVEIAAQFSWIKHLGPRANAIVETLFEKEVAYQGSWAARGGPGAFFVTCRKWDRIESIAKRHGYDSFWMLDDNVADVEDDVRDLIGYLLLWLAASDARKEVKDGLETPK